MTNFIEDNKDECIRFRVSKKQKELIKSMAKDSNLSMTRFLLELLELARTDKNILEKLGGNKVE
ncbi:TPA: hypothetical protein ACHTFF_002832 [Clostridioides difficile]|uniref:Uncharacterized protein n=1 Tax=Clostridioides difficile TaxID=1496 RepID=A0A069AND1_CLODI|nr:MULTISPECIES: hypothetical protein [Peptostreptococcaceae]AXU81262.1 hypothetical protein CDIF29688_03983 [Clostridioides difficile]EGT3759320.1 hypothetical protein [Clostridioides difficile]EGT3767153.1 hypothetical protein [Clostridioides difficile]EGT4110064.1 hypothetical protein [Clostridioides difficile]EGT4517163.1 hypothetical protein [Clostridioides difficile]